MRSEPDAMDPSVELLQQLVDEGVCSPKQISLWSGRESKTAYRYLNGELTPPPFVLRRIYEETGDLRLVLFVVGKRPICIHRMIETTAGNPKELLPILIAAVQETAASLEYCNKVVADGRVDAADDRAIGQFEAHAIKVLNLLPMAIASIKKFRAGVPA